MIDLHVSIRIVKEKLGHFLDIGVCYNGDWENFFCKHFEIFGPLLSDMFEIKSNYFNFELVKFQSSPVLVLDAIRDTDVFETMFTISYTVDRFKSRVGQLLM